MKKFEFVHETESPEEFIEIKDFFKDPKKSFYKGEHGRISNEEVFGAIGEIFYDRVIESGNPKVKIAPRDIIEKIYRERGGSPPATSNILRRVDFYKKFRTGFWKRLLEERKEGKLIYYQPRFLNISDPENRFDPIRAIDRGRILELRRKLEEKIEPKEEILQLTQIAKLSGLIIPKTEPELRNCFHTLIDSDNEIIPREDAKFLADVFKKDDFKIIVEGPPMVGKSVFAYLVAKEWLGKVGIVRQKLELTDVDIIKKENLLIVLDAGDLDIPLDSNMYSKLLDAKKLLIVRRWGEPRNLEVRDSMENTFPRYESFWQLKSAELKYSRFKCTIGKMDNVLDVINSIEKKSKVKVDYEIKREIKEICLTTDERYTVLGIIKAIFVGFESLLERGEISSNITTKEFGKIGAFELKEYKASEKILKHIYSWLDSDVQKLLQAYRFLQEFLVSYYRFNKIVFEEAYKTYHDEEILQSTIEKGIDLGLIFVNNEYSIWHPWQTEVIELKKEIEPRFDNLVSSLESALIKRTVKFGRSEIIALELSKILWGAHEHEKFKHIRDELLRKSLHYMKIDEILRYHSEMTHEKMMELLEEAKSHPGLYNMMKYKFGWLNEDFKEEKNLPLSLHGTLCLLTYKAISDKYNNAIPIAAALELANNAFLTHEDIMDMEVAEKRRLPDFEETWSDTFSAWKLYGVPHAINVGDGILPFANLVILQLRGRNVSNYKILQLFRILNERLLERHEGKYLDLRLEYTSLKDIGIDEYLEIAYKKTAKFVETAFEMGALLATEDVTIVKRFKKIGYNMGMAFQIRNEIASIWGVENQPSIHYSKKTLPILYTFASVDKTAQKSLLKIYEEWEEGNFTEQDTENIIKMFKKVRTHEYAKKLAEKYENDAIKELKASGINNDSTEKIQAIIKFLGITHITV